MGKQYVLVAMKQRVQRGPDRPDYVPERPYKKDSKGNKVPTGGDPHKVPHENPTLVTYDEHCQVNIPDLLAFGAIVEYVPPKKKEVKARGQSPAQPGQPDIR